jgi:O-antigen/teichoic acid export membrane protein
MPEKDTTRGDVVRLTIAKITDASISLFIPIVLVRVLVPSEYGDYRLFWLLASSVALLVPMGMSRSLLFFLPRSEQAEQSYFVGQTLFYLAVVTLPVAIILSSGAAWLPSRVSGLTDRDWLLGAFVFLWVVSSLVMTLPNADRDIRWQARATIGLALTRGGLVLGTAIMTSSLQALFVALLVFSIIQFLLLIYYILGRHRQVLRRPKRSLFVRQLGYALPFGISGILAQGRNYVEQWIVVALFAPAALAEISIALSLSGALQILRQSVGNVLIPKMSRAQAEGDKARSLELNNRGNIAISLLMFPIAAFICVFANPIIDLLFTAQYESAVPVLRVYTLSMILMSVELATVLTIYEQGRFVAKVSAAALVISATVSYFGATLYGLPGVAAGGVVGTLFTRLINYNRAASLLGVRFANLQDWRTLAKTLIAAIVSSIVAYYVATNGMAKMGSFWRLATGGVAMMLSFGALLFLLRIHWIPLCMVGRRSWPKMPALS